MKRIFSLPGLKLFFLAFVFEFASVCEAQRIFSENFENKTLSEAWHKVSGDWKIQSVQDMKITPAENGNEFVLCGEGEGFIRLIVDIADTVRASKIRLRFS